MPDRTLAHLGWDPARAADLDAEHRPARVLAAHGPLTAIATDDGERLAPARGSLRHRGLAPVVGDWVAVDADGAIADVLPREGVLSRAGEDGAEEVLAANVDVLLAATSLNQDLNVRRLERSISLARAGGIEAVVVLTKADLEADPFAKAAQVERALGVPTVTISVHDGWGLPELHEHLKPGTTAALLGMSGVGKSTLVNELLGEERQQTLPIRAKDDRGRHATTARELFVLPTGGLLIDTPGVRLQRLASADGVDEAFEDVAAFARDCRFADCTHAGEPGCAVQAAIASGDLDAERLDAMRKLEREARWAEERQGGPGEAARRARGRDSMREYRKIMTAKPRRD